MRPLMASRGIGRVEHHRGLGAVMLLRNSGRGRVLVRRGPRLFYDRGIIVSTSHFEDLYF